MIIAITGPTGVGKTTVSEGLAKKLGACVNIDADHIKHMIVDGFYKDESNPGGWSYNKWELVGESIALLTRNFAEKGYSVIINGYIDLEAWLEIEKMVTIDHKILLLPDSSEAKKRDAARSSDVVMGPEAVDRHYEHFTTDKYFNDFTKIDSTNLSIDATVQKLVQFVD